MMHEQVRQIRQRILSAFGQGIHADFADLIRLSLEEQCCILENLDDTTAMLRTQGGIRVLRQLLTDITPRPEN